jgi:hypothetical protein
MRHGFRWQTKRKRLFNCFQVTGISNKVLRKQHEKCVCVYLILQAVRKQLVHLGDAGGDAEVDGTVADLNDESTDDVGVDLVGDLELLAGADVGRLGDGRLES